MFHQASHITPMRVRLLFALTLFIHIIIALTARAETLPPSPENFNAASERANPIAAVNSPDRDNTAIITADGNVMFFNSTRQGDRPWARYSLRSRRYDDDIYYAVRTRGNDDAEQWSTPVNMGANINTGADDGIAAISPDGQTVYFNSLKQGWENDGGPFYSARLAGVEWASSHGMGGGITAFFRERERGFRIYGASISADARTFYFATTVGSSSGNHQIWASHYRDGSWSAPENLGVNINQRNGSFAPFIATDGATLFFTSLSTSGDDDIYVSRLVNGIWQPASAVDGLNSPKNESFPTIPASGDRIYLSIGSGDDDDIHVAPLPERFRPGHVALLNGAVVDHEGNAVEATIKVEDLKTGETIFTVSSNAASGSYTALLPVGRDYGVSISSTNHTFQSERFTIPADAAYAETHRDYTIEKLVVGRQFVANNIFFAHGMSTLTAESRPELERVAQLLKQNPALRIEIGGHTDSVGARRHNDMLSKNRARTVHDYLVTEHGIDPSRMHVNGYGASQPAGTNETEDGRRKNRRTEITILAM